MNREQAEKLLAAMIFDDLDEPSRAELLAYLQTDDELRDRLADMRMTAKLAHDAVNEGPDPVLDEHRLRQLRRLAGANGRKSQILTLRRLLAVAAVLTIGVVSVGLLLPSLSRVRSQAASESARPDRLMGMLNDEIHRSVREAAPEVVSSPASDMDTDPVERYARMRGTRVTRYETTNGSRMGGMGGMGGYGGGMGGNGDTRNYGGGMMGGMGMGGSGNGTASEPASGFGYSSTTASRDQEALGEVVANADKLSLLNGSDALSSGQWRARGPGISATLSQESEAVDESSELAERIRTKLELETASSRLRSIPQLKAKDVDGDTAGQGISYGDALSPAPGKPVAPASTPVPAESTPAFGVQSGPVPGLNRRTVVDGRAPTLGDMPTVGGLFRGEAKEERESHTEESIKEGVRKKRPDNATSLAIKADEADVLDLKEAVAPKDGVDLDQTLPPFESRFTVAPVNPWVMTERDALSTFALDVDTASYALCRRYIRSGFLPPIGAVRMEEFINAFDYAYPQRDEATFAVYAEGAPSPFAPAGQDLTLLKIAVKARTVGRDQRRAAHIVFVVDASASMGQPDRLPLVQSALNLLLDQLSDADRVSLVTCSDQARLHLEAVPAREKDAIRRTIDAIQPAGPTNLLAGLKVGYEMARRGFVAGQINQVVLCSDGVANVGRTEADDVLAAVADDRKQGITLTCVGVGYGAYNDAFLEAMANRGDGQYVFLDSSEQAQEDLVGQLAATLQTVAKDARIQVQFDPARVRRYRLIGYENRDIEDRRFRDDTVDAGEVGSGQCSTALYELELTAPSAGESDSKLGTVFVRYRNTETGQIEEISRALAASIVRRQSIEENPRFFLAAGAARFAEWLRQSEHARNTTPAQIQNILDRVSAVLTLDPTVQDLAAFAHQAENLPRASEAAAQP